MREIDTGSRKMVAFSLCLFVYIRKGDYDRSGLGNFGLQD